MQRTDAGEEPAALPGAELAAREHHETQQVKVGKQKPNPCCHGNNTASEFGCNKRLRVLEKENVSTFLVVCCHQ